MLQKLGLGSIIPRVLKVKSSRKPKDSDNDYLPKTASGRFYMIITCLISGAQIVAREIRENC